MTYSFTKYRYSDRIKHTMILTLEAAPGFFGRLIGRRTKIVEFIGSGAVWRTYPNCDRCDIWMESMLSSFYDKIKFGILKNEN